MAANNGEFDYGAYAEQTAGYAAEPNAQQYAGYEEQYPAADQYEYYDPNAGYDYTQHPGQEQYKYDTGGYQQEYWDQQQQQQGYQQYDQHGQPITFDEQGNALDYYGNIIYQDYYGQAINYPYYGGAEAAAPAVYQPSTAYQDPYGIAARQGLTKSVATGWEPEKPKTELSVQARIPKKKEKSEKEKKKKKHSEYVVTPSPFGPPGAYSAKSRDGNEVIVYPSQYPEWMASVAAAQAMSAQRPAIIPAAAAVPQPPIVHAAPFVQPFPYAPPPATVCSGRKRYEVIPAFHGPPQGCVISGMQGIPIGQSAVVRPFAQAIPRMLSPIAIGSPHVVEVTSTPTYQVCKPTIVRTVNPHTKEQTVKIVQREPNISEVTHRFDVKTNGKTTAIFTQKPCWTSRQIRNNNEIIHQVVKLPSHSSRNSCCVPFKRTVGRRGPPAEVYVVQSEVRPLPHLVQTQSIVSPSPLLPHVIEAQPVIGPPFEPPPPFPPPPFPPPPFPPPPFPPQVFYTPFQPDVICTSPPPQVVCTPPAQVICTPPPQVVCTPPPQVVCTPPPLQPQIVCGPPSPIQSQLICTQPLPPSPHVICAPPPTLQPQFICAPPSPFQPQGICSSLPRQPNVVIQSPQSSSMPQVIHINPSRTLTPTGTYTVDTKSTPQVTYIQPQATHAAPPPSIQIHPNVSKPPPMRVEPLIQPERRSSPLVMTPSAGVARTSQSSNRMPSTQGSRPSMTTAIVQGPIGGSFGEKEEVDRLVDQNLRLQKDIGALRDQLEKTLGHGEKTEMTIAEQNVALRRQIREVGKAVHDFVKKAPEGDAAAKLIEELSFHLNQSVDDVERLQKRLAERDQEIEKIKYDETGGAGLASEWYSSPLQADDIRHEMGLIDDLISQCQRIVAETTDRLWVTEYSVKDIVDKALNKCGLGEEENDVLDDPDRRADFLASLHELAQRHINEIFETRQDLDHLQEQIENIKARAWDPKRNIPYCSCRPRRDVLEDDVTHLMERLHEASDQSCQLRERLLATELENLTLKLEEARTGVQTRAAISHAVEGVQLRRQRETLQERIHHLESQIQHLQMAGGTRPAFVPLPKQIQHTLPTTFPVTPPPISAPLPLHPTSPFKPRQAPTYPSHLPSVVGGPRGYPGGYYGKQLGYYRSEEPLEKTDENIHQRRPTKAERRHLKEIQETQDKMDKLRQNLMNDLENHEKKLFGLKRDFGELIPSPIEPGAWQGTKSRIVKRMQDGAEQLHTLVHKLEEGVAKEEDLGMAYQVSMDLTDLASEAQAELDFSKLTNKEKNLLKKVQQQANDLLTTNKGLQRLGKGQWREIH